MFLSEDFNRPITTIDFDIVEAGKSKEIIIFLFNDSDYDIEDINVVCTESNVKIKADTHTLLAKKFTPIKLEWSPKLTIKKALETNIEIRGYEIIRPKYQL